MKKLISAGIVALSLVGTGAFAQTASTVLVANLQEVIVTTDAGKDMNNKLMAIANAMKAELTPEGNAIDAEVTKLEQTPASQLQSDAFVKQRDALNLRAQNFENKKRKVSADLQATRQDALEKFQTSLDPVVKSLMAEKNATVLLDSSMVTYAVPSVDVTATLVAKMNATTKTIAVTRQSVPVQGAATATQPATTNTGAPLPRQPGKK
jgi:outer membrane protein